jgi:hypothetical protein
MNSQLVEALKGVLLTALEAERGPILAKLAEANVAVAPLVIHLLEGAMPKNGLFALIRPEIERAINAAEPQLAAALATQENALFDLVVAALTSGVKATK